MALKDAFIKALTEIFPFLLVSVLFRTIVLPPVNTDAESPSPDNNGNDNNNNNLVDDVFHDAVENV